MYIGFWNFSLFKDHFKGHYLFSGFWISYCIWVNPSPENRGSLFRRDPAQSPEWSCLAALSSNLRDSNKHSTGKTYLTS